MADLSKQLLFFISTLGWFNGVILSIYFLFFVKNKTLSNYLLGFLLLCLSFRVSKSVIWYFNPEVSAFFIQFGLCVCLFIGPLLFLYIKTSINQAQSLSKTDKGILGLIFLISFVLLVFFASDLSLWRKYFVKIIYTSWFFIILGTGILLRPIFKKGKFKNLKPNDKWLLTVYFSNLMIVLFYIMSFLKILNMAYISGAMAFSFVVYLNLLILFYRKKTTDLLNNEKYQNKKIEQSEAQTLIQRLEETIQKQDVYNNPELKLGDLAGLMGISSHQLSQLLNDNLQKSFSTYLNEFRIKKSCELITSGTNLKVEAIGYEVGFQSKSAFFASFKKITGVSPSKFREKMIFA